MPRARTAIELTQEAIANAVARSITFADALRHLGLSPVGSAHKRFKRTVQELGISTAHFMGSSASRVVARKQPQRKDPTELLVLRETGRRTPGLRLRRALLEIGREYKCADCGIGPVHNGKPFTLEVHHGNGNPRDNRETNLVFLCPICHQQATTTPDPRGPQYAAIRHVKQDGKLIPKRQRTYKKPVKRHLCQGCANSICQPGLCAVCAQKRRRKVVRPDKRKLTRLLWQIPTSSIAKQYGVSDSAVGKWAQQYGLEKPPRGYWTHRDKTPAAGEERDPLSVFNGAVGNRQTTPA